LVNGVEVEKEYNQNLLQFYLKLFEKDHKQFSPMLKVLSRHNDVNRLDQQGKSPLYNLAYKRLPNPLDQQKLIIKNIFENEQVLIEAGARVDFIADTKEGSNILQLIIKNP
jgi:hypothetical protein